jgi:hypothetical protein
MKELKDKIIETLRKTIVSFPETDYGVPADAILALFEQDLMLINKEATEKNFYNDVVEANDILRSCYQVIKRKGKDTRWDALKEQIHKVLIKQHKIMYPIDDSNEHESRKITLKEANEIMNKEHPEVLYTSQEPPKEVKSVDTLDLMQYVTNLLYAAANEGPTMGNPAFDNWVDEQIKNLESYHAQFQTEQRQVIDACDNWMPDKTTSATRCKNCGKDRWQHPL